MAPTSAATQHVASFDVFDTVLTRLAGSPQTVFRAVGRRLVRNGWFRGTPESFVEVRKLAEQRAIGNFSAPALTLDRIYAELASALLLSEAETRRIRDLELRVEAEMLREVPGARDRIRAARHAGQRVVFISDMYLSAEFLRDQLAAHGLWQSGDSVYVSSEVAKCKSSGRLFRHVLDSEGWLPGDVCHEGNHEGADVRGARRCGLRARMFGQGNLNRYEEILERYAGATEGLSSVLAGTSRITRLSVPAADARQRALRDVAAGVMAPVLAGFVIWVLHRARQLGLERLYFVSRDGQVLLRIAAHLAPRVGFTGELRYLHGSREAWCVPSEGGIDDELINWALPPGEFPSASAVLFRLGIAPSHIAARMEQFGIPRAQWAQPLTPQLHQALRRLLENASFQQDVLSQAETRREACVGYLRQEGLFDVVPWAMVDVGWRGTMQYFLRRILQAHGGPQPIGLYCGICRSGMDADTGPREAYVADERTGCGFTHHLYRLARPFEVFCSADHGTVRGYEPSGDGFRPVLEGLSSGASRWDHSLVQGTVERFAEQLPLDADWLNPQADVRHATLEALDAFWSAPTTQEARAWGAFRYEENRAGGTEGYQLAGGYSWLHLAAAVCTGQVQRLKRHDFSWHEGSVALSPSPIKVVIQQAMQAASLARRVGARVRRPLSSHRSP